MTSIHPIMVDCPMKLLITRYSHHYEVTRHQWLAPSILTSFIKRFLHIAMYRDKHGMLHEQDRRVYAASNAKRTYYRLHIHTLDDFLLHLDQCGVSRNDIEIVDEPLYDGAQSDLRMLPHLTPKETQVPLIEFFLQKTPNIKLCKLQTGGGKTFCALSASARLKKLFVLIVRPKYIQNWEVALYGKERVTNVEKDRVRIVQGSKELKQLIAEAIDTDGHLPYDFIIISNRTYANYIDEFESEGDLTESYGCNPIDFLRTVRAHCLLRDEVHLDFHLNFRIDLYTHVPLSISLSATFTSADLVLSRLQCVQYPPITHAPAQTYNRYVHVRALRYEINNVYTYRWNLRGRTDYNHIAFEQSLMKKAGSFSKWLAMVCNIIQEEYVDRRLPGTRYIVTASSTAMVCAIAEALVERFPQLKVSTYIEGSDFLEVKESDIVVTTVMSGTAAIDIKGLIGGLMTTSIGSETTNLQAVGRIRPLVQYPDVALRFCYLYTADIPQSLKYHEAKVSLLQHRVLSHQSISLNTRI